MRKAVWLMFVFLGLTCVGMWRGAGIARSTLWERYMAAGDRLQAQGRLTDAARRYQAAIRRAERFGPSDRRLAISLSRYAALLRATGRNAAATPLEARARAIESLHPGAPSSAPSATAHPL